ncbi:aminodeoxychorismate synthase component I [Reinekea sp. G2M2-21]|uniref:aminodeoxychorismate synthase component I n=1 Tax=Reinekea sp. G2M2-21 TaxID=2788942 RepID=UPI0018A893E1|nr:aminodeoxychorismate synthase component I [Reinekea sp. G2M2-21]
MLITDLTYSPDTSLITDLFKDAPGLIWYHSGQETQESEWISAWPTEEYCYLGQRKIQVSDFLGNGETHQADWFEFLKQKSNQHTHSPSNLKFTGGLAGHLSYDLGLELLGINSRHFANTQPLAVVGLYHWCVYFDHQHKRTYLITHNQCPKEIISRVKERLSAPEQLTDKPTQRPLKNTVGHWQCGMSRYQYDVAFAKIKSYIVEGDAYQINLTRQWTCKTTNTNDWALYRQLIKKMPAPFSVFHRTHDHSLLSVSPERFIQIQGKTIITQPIKGTRPRSVDPVEDEQHKTELLTSEKDRSENLMIVDLLRNDLSKNAQAGSVTVSELFSLHSFTNVHHLVSTIKATLAEGKHPLDALRDAFPGGSITGAPKKRAMEIIDELETVRRGNYCGCSFYLSADLQFDSNILIRTVTLTSNTLSCSGGGGIVFDSECDSEFEESEVKVRRILTTLTS